MLLFSYPTLQILYSVILVLFIEIRLFMFSIVDISLYNVNLSKHTYDKNALHLKSEGLKSKTYLFMSA